MKSLVIVLNFLLITEVQQSYGGEENKPKAISNTFAFGNDQEFDDLSKFVAAISGRLDDAGKQIHQAVPTIPSIVTSNPIHPAVRQTNPQTLREKADKIRDKASKVRAAALKDAISIYNQFKKIVKQITDKNRTKQLEKKKNVELEHLKADITAATIWRNAQQKWANEQKNAENQYQEARFAVNQKIKDIQQVRDAALHAADEQFVRTYTQAVEKRKKVESENAEVWAEGRAEYENAVKSAEKMKTQAEKEFWTAAKSYNLIPRGEWAIVTNRHDGAMEDYEIALQDADINWQKVLDKLEIGGQQRCLDKAITELVNAHKKAETVAKQEMEKLEEELKGVEKLKTDLMENDVMRSGNNDKQRAEAEFKKAVEKNKKQAENKYNSIFKDEKKRKGMSIIELRKSEGDFQEKKIEIAHKFDEAMKKASAIENGT